MAKRSTPQVGETVTYVRDDGTETLGRVVAGAGDELSLQLINDAGTPTVTNVLRGDGPGTWRADVDAGDDGDA